jgi:hypothetical protein
LIGAVRLTAWRSFGKVIAMDSFGKPSEDWALVGQAAEAVRWCWLEIDPWGGACHCRSGRSVVARLAWGECKACCVVADTGLVVRRFDRIRSECKAHFCLIHHSDKSAAGAGAGAGAGD